MGATNGPSSRPDLGPFPCATGSAVLWHRAAALGQENGMQALCLLHYASLRIASGLSRGIPFCLFFSQ